MSKSKQEKLKEIIKGKKDPNFAISEKLSELDGLIEKITRQVLKELTTDAKKEFEDVIAELLQDIPEFKETIREGLQDILKEKIGKDGIAKLKGERGTDGDSIKGDKGDSVKGDMGEKGERGDIGDKGEDGIKGKDGENGKDGSPDKPLEIAEKLNTLTEKVDIGVIKGLGKEIKNLFREVRKKGGGGGGGGLGNVVHESFSTGTGTTTVTLSNNIAANGFAIWAYYEGQFIVRGTHYTQSGKVLTLTFTPDADSNIDTVYIRT